MICGVDDRRSNAERLHFLLIPLMAQGHMIPMVDLAKLLAARNTLVTFATTPANLARLRPIIDQAAASALSLRFVELRFPATEFGLPDGCESSDLIPAADLLFPFMNALSHLRGPLEARLRGPDPDGWPEPDCLISDNLQHWTAGVARELGIPRLIFHGPPCLFMLCELLIGRNRGELEDAMAAPLIDSVILPGLPHPIRIHKHEVLSIMHKDPAWVEYMESVRAAEESADGVLVNSFTELEKWYFDKYHEMISKPVWPVGPLSLYKEELDLKAARGRVSSTDNEMLFHWLDGQEIGSVILVSFGSMVRHTAAQIVELGRGLEASGRPFVWVVKDGGAAAEWVAGMEKRVAGRGIVIRGWAPQAVILAHAAVGGFMTHCGWNSALEAAAAGVVMAAWPQFYDQFVIEQLVVEVLGIGVSVGVKEPKMFGLGDGDEAAVKVIGSGEIESVVERLMGGGEEAEERRERAREIMEKARIAMEEGGSSWKGLQDAIDYVLERKTKGKGTGSMIPEVEFP